MRLAFELRVSRLQVGVVVGIAGEGFRVLCGMGSSRLNSLKFNLLIWCLLNIINQFQRIVNSVGKQLYEFFIHKFILVWNVKNFNCRQF